jgi:hypothetical protein
MCPTNVMVVIIAKSTHASPHRACMDRFASFADDLKCRGLYEKVCCPCISRIHPGLMEKTKTMTGSDSIKRSL